MSFINLNPAGVFAPITSTGTTGSTASPINSANGSHHHRRTSSIANCDNNNVITGEWTAVTETDNLADPFGEQLGDHGSQNTSDTDTDSQTHTRTIIRKIGLKRNKETVSLDSRVKLERVLGLTVSSNVSLDCDSHTGTVVYPSGCVLVLYNQRRNKQIHIINSLKKPITACKFSKDGKYIVTGECGHQPQVRIWEVATGEQLASLAGHKYDINCVAFSPNGKYVVSVGSQHDMLVNVWDWKNDHVVASNKVSVKVNSVSFSDDGDYFVTVGNRHVKFWYLDYNDMANKNKFESLPLMGRNAILGDQRNNYFCDVACGRGESKESTYAITKSGLLCEFNNRRLLDKWVELKTESANCITLSRHFICVGCAQGVIRCFKPQSLEFVCTLPRPHSLGLDIAKGFTARNDGNTLTKLNSANNKPKYADTIAVSYDEINKIVTTIYSDRSIYFWTLGDIKRIGKLNSFFYHSHCIWDIEMYPAYAKSAKPLLPRGTFLTCSGDDTIRIWNTEFEQNSSVTAKNSPYIYKKNIFSSELLKILYMDPDMTYLCDQDLVQSRNGNGGGANGNGANAKEDTSYDSKNGVRAIKFSNDGRHLASGDRCGNIRIFDLEFQKDLYKIEAHDGEVLCLEYSNEEFCGRALLVSASRDRMIHVYDVHRQYSCIQNIDDHSSSITSVKFVCDKLNPSILQMVSCGADKSLIFRKQFDADQDFRLEHHVAGKSTYYDMAVDENKNHILTVSQDRLIRVYDTKTGKNSTSFKGSLGDDGALIKTAFDPSATFIATSCTDKSIYIFDYQSGECLATTSGHSEIVTGLKFSLDGRHLISISGDGCIFQWRLPVEMTNAIASKLGLPLISDSCHTTTITNKSLHLPLTNSTSNEPTYRNGTNSPQTNSQAYRFSIGSLPSWAKKQMFEELSRDHPVKPSDYLNETDKSASSKTLPRGRWAQRVIEEGPSDIVLNQGLVKTYASTFETLASRSTPSTPSGTNSPTLKELKMNRLNPLATPTRTERAKSSLSSGVEDDDEDRNTTDSENTYSHDSSYKVTKADVRSKGPRHHNNKHNGGNYGMISSISMANINDLPFDEEDINNSHKNKDDSDNRYSSLYMSTENLERIDQRNRYLKNVFENIDKGNFENNASSASDDSGINQIDHSLSSTTTSGTLVSGAGLLNGSLPPPHPNSRQSLSSKFNNKTQSPINAKYDGATSDDATTLSDNTDIQQEQSDTVIPVELPKFSILDTIKETPAKEDTVGLDSINAKLLSDLTNLSINVPFVSVSDSSSVSSSSTLVAVPKSSESVSTSSVSGGNSNNTQQPTSNSQPSVSKKREELRKTLTDAKKKLESLGWKESSLTNSKSVANLRDEPPDTDKDEKSYNSLSHDAYRKSISLSDLSMSPGSQTLPKRLSVYRSNINNNHNTNSLSRSGTPGNMNHFQFAPLWDSRRTGAMPAPNSGSLSRSPSTNALNKVDMMRSQSTLCRQPGLWSAANNGVPPMVPHQQAPNGAIIKPPNGHLNVPSSGSSSLMINPRSGRSSAPPSQFRKANSAATVSCASSSRRGDSTEDDEELESTINSDDDNSDEHRNLRPRPVTPPKPNILKQIRRGSNASNQATAAAHYANGHYAQHHPPPSSQSAMHPTRQRRLWSTDTMRSSKSEFNLASIGRETPVRRRNNSGVSSGGAWPPNSAMAVHGDRLDLYMTNPSSIPLSLDLCQHLINEMNFLTNYAARIHERASYSTNHSIVDYLNETMGQVSRDIQNLINRQPTTPAAAGSANASAATTTNSAPPSASKNSKSEHSIAPDTQEMFQKFLTFLQFQQMSNGNGSGGGGNSNNNSLSSSTQPSSTNGPNNARLSNNNSGGTNLSSQNNDHFSS